MVDREEPQDAQRIVSDVAVHPEILFVAAGSNTIKWEETRKVLAEWSTLIVPHP
jgi:hypothetical protein